MQSILIWLLIFLTSHLSNQSLKGTYQTYDDEPGPSLIFPDSAKIESTDKAGSSESSSIVYQAIDRQCGSCHQGSHSTNTKALAIFNLADECWYCKLTREQAADVIRRTKGSAFTVEEQDAIKSLMEKIAPNTL